MNVGLSCIVLILSCTTSRLGRFDLGFSIRTKCRHSDILCRIDYGSPLNEFTRVVTCPQCYFVVFYSGATLSETSNSCIDGRECVSYARACSDSSFKICSAKRTSTEYFSCLLLLLTDVKITKKL